MASPRNRLIAFLCAVAIASSLRHHDSRAMSEVDAAPAQPQLAAASRSPWAADLPKSAPDTPNAVAGPAVITRDRNGTFHLNGAINGRSLDMLVDTGANLVAIPVDQAPSLGIVVRADEFQPVVRTASGTANAAPIHIDSLTIGAVELRNVDALVVEGLDRVLLGQSALRRLGKVSIEGDHMEIGGS